MSRPGEDDRDAVDRVFADLVAKFHLTAERPEGKRAEQPGEVGPVSTANEAVTTSNESISTSNESRSTRDEGASGAEPGLEPFPPDGAWADSHPLFRFPDAEPAPERPEPQERFFPEPPMPLRRPAWPVLVAWLAMGYAVLAVLTTALGVRLPVWAGWLALIGFVGGFGLLVARLPRHRPPDAGDGAVL